MNNTMSESACLAILLALCLAFIGGCSVGRYYEESKWEKKCINLGVADWRTNQYKQVFFKLGSE